MPYHLLSHKKQSQLMQAKTIVPLFVFLFGLSLVLGLCIILQKYEKQNVISQSSLEIRDYAKQLEMNVLNSVIRVQLMLEMYGPDSKALETHQNSVEENLHYTLFQRLTIFRVLKSSDNDGLPILKRIFRTNSNYDHLPLSSSAFMSSEQLRKKIATLQATKNINTLTFNHNETSDTFVLIWRISSQPQEYAVAMAPLFSLFKDPPTPSTFLNLEDMDTGALLTLSWSEDKKIKVVPVDFLQKSPHVLITKQSFIFSRENSSFSHLISSWYTTTQNPIGPITYLVFFSGLTIASLISLLLRFILYQNKKVAEIVVKRTVDLESSLNAATEANLAKTRFLANISHELRTPLNLIIGMLDLIEEKSIDKKILEYINTTKLSATHLLTLIKDLLDAAQKDDNEIEIKNIPIRIPTFFEEIVSIIKIDCDHKGLALKLEIDPELPHFFRGDPARIRQILFNLLRNSIKYTIEGSVELRVFPIKTSSNNKRLLRLCVRDSGIGIPQEKQHQVFDRFLQLETSKVLGQGGVGLGLSIVKDLVNKMNGNITIESQAGVGSTFSVDLDFSEDDSQKNWIESHLQSSQNGISIAIFCTDTSLVELLKKYLPSPYFKYEILNSMTNLLESTLSKYQYLFIDELNLSSEIEKILPLTKIVVLRKTTNLPPIGFKSLHTQPLLPTQLFDILGIKTVTKPQKVSIQPPVPNTLLNKKKMNILLADDDAGNRSLFSAYLSDLEWNIDFAEDGQLALNKYYENTYDMILADLHMPHIDGLELCEKIRSHERNKNQQPIPILLITADALDKTQSSAKMAGASLFLTKPIRKNELRKAIASLIEQDTPT